jgi:hypothetical protein
LVRRLEGSTRVRILSAHALPPEEDESGLVVLNLTKTSEVFAITES